MGFSAYKFLHCVASLGMWIQCLFNDTSLNFKMWYNIKERTLKRKRTAFLAMSRH
jgi:hypothetical protein